MLPRSQLAHQKWNQLVPKPKFPRSCVFVFTFRWALSIFLFAEYSEHQLILTSFLLLNVAWRIVSEFFSFCNFFSVYLSHSFQIIHLLVRPKCKGSVKLTHIWAEISQGTTTHTSRRRVLTCGWTACLPQWNAYPWSLSLIVRVRVILWRSVVGYSDWLVDNPSRSRRQSQITQNYQGLSPLRLSDQNVSLCGFKPAKEVSAGRTCSMSFSVI